MAATAKKSTSVNEVSVKDMTVREINSISERIGKQSKGLDEAIQRHAVIIGKHISKHGDVTIADYLVKMLSEGLRKNALRQWFLELGGCNWNADKKQFSKKQGFIFSEDKANEEPWYRFRPEPEFHAINSEALLKALIAKLKRGLEDDRNTIKKEHIQALELALDGKAPAFIVKQADLVPVPEGDEPDMTNVVGIKPEIDKPESEVETETAGIKDAPSTEAAKSKAAAKAPIINRAQSRAKH